MRVLLLHPEDDFYGPWLHGASGNPSQTEATKKRVTQKEDGWDWIVDLGRAPRSFYDERSAALGCRVSSIYDLAVEIDDLQVWRNLLAAGMGKVVDGFGIDWWEVMSLMLHPEMQDLRLARRLAEQLGACRTLAASRPSLLAEAVRLQLGLALQVFQSGIRPRVTNRVARYMNALMNLSFQQLRQVGYDKYDPFYRWRRKFTRFAPQPLLGKSALRQSAQPVVLLPSAYVNVTKTALNYARLLPEQEFLLVLARESAAVSPVPANVATAPLSAFVPAKVDTKGEEAELCQLENSWLRMERSLDQDPDLTSPFSASVRLGILNRGKSLLRWGLTVRNAWNRIFETRAVIGCLSADDTNPYTRIPLMLAARRGLPAISCHHGALDCRMAFKVPRFSTYLAQGEMERDYVERVCGVDPRSVRIGAATQPAPNNTLWRDDAPWIVFFTEPYETDLWRVAAIYREVLPQLCAAARKARKTVVLKLHPFETIAQRRRLVKASLDEDDQKLVSIIGSPLSLEILRNTWCAFTVESTVAFECASVGIPVFLSGWLRHAYSGYVLQYARFDVGRILQSAADLSRIPEIMKEMPIPKSLASGPATRLVQTISPEALAEVLLQPAAI